MIIIKIMKEKKIPNCVLDYFDSCLHLEVVDGFLKKISINNNGQFLDPLLYIPLHVFFPGKLESKVGMYDSLQDFEEVFGTRMKQKSNSRTHKFYELDDHYSLHFDSDDRLTYIQFKETLQTFYPIKQ